jgi:uncharacterized protein
MSTVTYPTLNSNKDSTGYNTPFLGSGLGYRREIRNEVIEHSSDIDFVEIIAEQFMISNKALEGFDEIKRRFKIIPHGIGLSIGSASPLDWDYLRSIRSICDLVKAPFYSEHLCVTKSPGIDLGHLSPLWFTEKALTLLIDKVNAIQDYLGLPLVLENTTYFFDIPQNSLSQTELFQKLVDVTDCRILLDITNVAINAMNHGYEPTWFIKQLPVEKIAYLHLAGWTYKNDFVVDSHSRPVQEETWKLMEFLSSATSIKGAVIEHDSNFLNMPEFLSQLKRAKKIMLSSSKASYKNN